MHPRPPAARSMRGKAVMRRHLGEGGVAVVEGEGVGSACVRGECWCSYYHLMLSPDGHPGLN